MKEYDYVFLGSPTYFGLVSAQIKAFMDSLCDLWVDAELFGKKFGCFSSASTPQGGGDMCLLSMNLFAQHMGMTVLSVPSNLGFVQPAYGISHASGPDSDIRPSKETLGAIDAYKMCIRDRYSTSTAAKERIVLFQHGQLYDIVHPI